MKITTTSTFLLLSGLDWRNLKIIWNYGSCKLESQSWFVSSSLFPPKKVIQRKIFEIVLVCDRAVNTLRMLMAFSLSNAAKFLNNVTHSGYRYIQFYCNDGVIDVICGSSKPRIRLRFTYVYSPILDTFSSPLHFISEYVCFVLSGTLWTRNKITSKNQIHFPVQTCMRWCPNVQFIQI